MVTANYSPNSGKKRISQEHSYHSSHLKEHPLHNKTDRYDTTNKILSTNNDPLGRNAYMNDYSIDNLIQLAVNKRLSRDNTIYENNINRTENRFKANEVNYSKYVNAESHQKGKQPSQSVINHPHQSNFNQNDRYELSRPTWFELIMEKMANN